MQIIKTSKIKGIESSLKEILPFAFVNDTMPVNILKILIKEEKIHKFKDIAFAQVLYKFQFDSKSDIFKFIDNKIINQLKRKEIYFVLDLSQEGWAPIFKFADKTQNFFDCIHSNCDLYNINPKQIIFVSSNLKLEETYRKYILDNNINEKINCLGIPAFQYSDTKYFLNYDINYFYKAYNSKNNKIFSSLSRTPRFHREYATMLLTKSPIEKYGMISCNKHQYLTYKTLPPNSISEKEFIAFQYWTKCLPLVIDKSNFQDNWALDNDFVNIHNMSTFQIVNETEVNDWNKTSMFFSEKTFRACLTFLPFVIYGQPGINKYLSNIGYKTYEDWFDYSFDDEEDPINRYKLLLNSITDTVMNLKDMNESQRRDWRFKNTDVLIHNFNQTIAYKYSKDKLCNLINNLD